METEHLFLIPSIICHDSSNHYTRLNEKSFSRQMLHLLLITSIRPLTTTSVALPTLLFLRLFPINPLYKQSDPLTLRFPTPSFSHLVPTKDQMVWLVPPPLQLLESKSVNLTSTDSIQVFFYESSLNPFVE